MKNPFDRIVGPDGEWRPDDARTEESEPCEAASPGPLTAREEFALRCLNAAANLYGVVTMEEFVRLYNGYAKDHAAPVSNEMTVDELEDLVDHLHDVLDLPDEDGAPDLEDVVNRPDVWYSTWDLGADTPRLIVSDELTDVEDLADGEEDRVITHRIAGLVAKFRKMDLKILPEDEFLEYEEPLFGGEDTDATCGLSELIQDDYGMDEKLADLDVWAIQSHLRVNGPKIGTALQFIRDTCDWGPDDSNAFDRLVRALGPVVGETRTWIFRGHTQQEACRLGVIDKIEREDIPDVFGLFDDDYIHPEEIPLSHYEGAIDFKFVKDPARRDEKLAVYEDVRQVTREYVRAHVIEKMTKKARHAAAVRLGFLKKSEKLEKLDPTLDCVVGDFASMMDDQCGEPAVKCALKKKGELDEVYARAASYYENYRYTWLEILAVKASLGLKCRDLLTGEELFLMETSLSQSDVKGMTICVGIAPMVDVYIVLGVIAPAHFENPALILKIVLSGLGLPTELPIRLSPADQAKFAAETIRRIHATGRFDTLVMG